MEDILNRFPHLGKLTLNNLDNKSLINGKKASRDVSKFLENEKFFWVRILKRYHRNIDRFEESWKEVIKKTSFEMMKQLAVMVQNFFQLYPIIKNLESSQVAPIHIAAAQNNVDLCKFIYEKTKNKNPKATLQLDCNDHKIEIAKYSQSNKYLETSLTPIHIAAIKGHLEVFKLIFVNALDRNPATEREKLTPLHLAAQNGHFEICKHIIENIEDKNPLAKYERTPLHTAVANGHIENGRLMINNILDINSVDAYGETPLHMRNGHLEICWIIMKDKNPAENPADFFGKTPLHLAAEHGHFEICQLLIADIDDKHPVACNGMTPKDYAFQYGHNDILKLFDNKKKRKNGKGKK